MCHVYSNGGINYSKNFAQGQIGLLVHPRCKINVEAEGKEKKTGIAFRWTGPVTGSCGGKKKKANDALVPYVESHEKSDKGRRDGEKWWWKKFGLATV